MKKVVRLLLLASCFLSAQFLSAQVDAERVIRMGRNALYFDDYVTALQLFTQAIDAKPYMASAYYFRAYTKFSLEDYRGAEADCSKSIELNPYIPEVYQLRGLCRIHNNDYTGAAEDYSKALKDLPDDQASIYNRALCYLETDEYDKAEQDALRLAKLAPSLPKTFILKAQVAFEKKDTLAGIAELDSMLAKHPHEYSAWQMKGRYALQKEEYAEADSFLTQAISLRPEMADDYTARALARYGLKRYGKALEDYDAAIERVPSHFIAHYNRGLLRAQVGDDNRAIEDFDFVIRLEPDNILARYNRALLREQTGDFRGAIDDFSHIIKEYPNFTYGYAARARCRRKIGDTRGALADETVVSRAELDLMYGKAPNKTPKKVRKRSEHSLDAYQQFVEEDPDTTVGPLGELFGKVQNRKVEKQFLPFFTLTLSDNTAKGAYTSIAFLPEVERLNKKRLTKRRITMSASEKTHGVAELGDELKMLELSSAPKSEKLLVSSAIHRMSYNYVSARTDADAAIREDSTSSLAYAERSVIIAEESRISANSKSASQELIGLMLQQALSDASRAIALAPSNAYLYYNRGCLYAESKSYANAIADFSKAIELDNRLAEAYYNRAVAYLFIGEPERAIPDLSRAGEIGLYKAYNLLKQASKEAKTAGE